jgi:type II secretory pathway pseudopilin PulG
MIELMIVIAIIAILISLLLAGVQRVLVVQERVETQSDITQMTQSLDAARTTYGKVTGGGGPEFFPSKLILHNDISKYRLATATADEKRTAAVLRQMFGKRFISNGTTVAWLAGGATASRTLQGSECLVFYLGGMSDLAGSRCLGFSTNPLDPTAAGGERLGPYFQFKSTRLVAGPSGSFFHYLDRNGRPFVFFGAISPNSYDATHAHEGVSPYYESGSSTNWLRPNSFQIISAGRDKAFGAGGALNIKTGYSSGTSGADDLANFSSTDLGNPIE